MDIKQIQDLIRFVSKSGVNEVEIEQKDFKITIRTNQQPVIAQHTVTAPSTQPALAQPQAPQPAVPASAPAINSPTAPAAEDTSKFVTIKSPMIGTFYRSSGPDKANYANVGDEIKSGQVLCIIEAMKLFNEIESEVSGKIVKVLVENSSPVEYDQPLFLIDPA